MRPIVRFALVTLAVISSVTPAIVRGQSLRRQRPPASDGATICCLSKLSAAEEARIAERIELARVLATVGSLAESRTILHDVIADEKRGEMYAGVALRMLANVEFSLDRPTEAAEVLIDLADEAARVSDPNTEIQALVDAIIVFSQEGRRSQARALVPRVRRLLDSPAIPAETRRELARMLPLR